MRTTNPNSKENAPQHVEEDQLVSCPIVCGEYMRATGFFYAIGGTTYLITARHNCLPTTGKELKTGEATVSFQSMDTLPNIDVYFRNGDGFAVERIDITDADGVVQTPEIDILAVPIDTDPRDYGYRVWAEPDVTAPQNAPDELTSVGFTGLSFPAADRSYDIDWYRAHIGHPVSLQLVNEMNGDTNVSRHGLMPVAIDTEVVGNDDQYDGLSGAPITGDGLVGIHSHTTRPPKAAIKKAGFDEYVLISYTRADLLPKLLTAATV